MRYLLGHALLLSLVLGTGACSTPRGSSSSSHSNALASEERVDWNVKPPPRDVTGHPVRVTFLAYGSGQVFELVNESHTNPHEYYSKKIPADQAYRKIQSDEVVEALMGRLKDQGILKAAVAGAAPKYAKGTRAQSFEIETGSGVEHWTVTENTPVDVLKPFVQAKNEFIQLWSATSQMQAVEGAVEWKGASKGKSAGIQPLGSSGKVQ
ncbi:MAG: hypothetical protein HZA53_12705 [Planctomycetes bacterium]|nr:hypothetical protein [Planctomycetota bacterium]